MNMSALGFATFEHQDSEITHTVYVKGSGPAVVLMHEVSGMTPECITLARRLAVDGFRVYCPLLFGRPGQDKGWRPVLSRGVRREFLLSASRESAPITGWLRSLCRRAWDETNRPAVEGVGVIGMGLTGGFVLSMMADEWVLAPVASQPSLPLFKRRSLGVSDGDLGRAKQRAREGVPILALRFSGDLICPGQRFDRLKQEFKSDLETIVIDSSQGNSHGIRRRAHSVLTADFRGEAEHPTRKAYDRVVQFMKSQVRRHRASSPMLP